MSVRLQELNVRRGEDISLAFDEASPFHRLYVRVHSDGRVFILAPTATDNNIFELTLEGLIAVSEEDYLKSQ